MYYLILAYLRNSRSVRVQPRSGSLIRKSLRSEAFHLRIQVPPECIGMGAKPNFVRNQSEEIPFRRMLAAGCIVSWKSQTSGRWIAIYPSWGKSQVSVQTFKLHCLSNDSCKVLFKRQENQFLVVHVSLDIVVCDWAG